MNNSKVFVIGDSHTRSFNSHYRFVPIFIGPGKEFCFVSSTTKDNVLNCLKLLLEHAKSGDSILLCLGEPDTRYFLEKGWQPWTSLKEESVKDIDQKVGLSFSRYREVIEHLLMHFQLNLFVLSVLPSIRRSQNLYTLRFNSLLRDFLSTRSKVTFIDIEDSLMGEDLCLLPEFVADPVHCNGRLADLVETKLVSLCKVNGFTDEANFVSEIEPAMLKKCCKYDDRFRCFRPLHRKSISKRVISLFRIVWSKN